jgi:zinc transporter ZupT
MATAAPPGLALKAAGAALLSAESLAGALLPVLLARHPGPLALASCFGGGVFLAAALLHLLPHCAEQAEALLLAAGGAGRGRGGHHHHHDPHHHHHHRHHHRGQPSYLALVLLGYLLVLAAERVLFEHAHGHGHGHGHGGHGHGDGDGHGDADGRERPGHRSEDAKLDEEKEREEEEEPAAARGRRAGAGTLARRKAGRAAAASPAPRSASRGRRAAATSPSPRAAATPRREPAARNQRPAKAAAAAAAAPPRSRLDAAGLRSCLVAVLATSVHTLLECAALGLASDARGFWALLAAIAAHKPASALALSSRFLRAGATPREAAGYTSLFALVAPAGVAAGAFAVGVGAEAELWLSCLSAGAFLYVGLTEVIAEEVDGRGGWRSRWSKFGALLAGVASVAALGGHEH